MTLYICGILETNKQKNPTNEQTNNKKTKQNWTLKYREQTGTYQRGRGWEDG